MKLSTKLINIIYSILQISLIMAFIVKKEYLSLVGSILVFILYLLFLLYEHKKGIQITDFIRISVLVSLFSSSFIGEYLRLYTTSVYFDKFLHVFGTFSYTIFIFYLVEKRGYLKGLIPPLIFMFILSFGTFLGTLFEIAEFIPDVLFKTANQNGLIDTDLDMICNIFGSALAGIFMIYQKK